MRKIYCKKCGEYLGEIRDATLRKRITFICGDCQKYKKYKNSEAYGYPSCPSYDKETMDSFNQIFGEILK
jgi:RNase P subunit RPR2